MVHKELENIDGIMPWIKWTLKFYSSGNIFRAFENIITIIIIIIIIIITIGNSLKCKMISKFI